jgi:hypothetical protein
LRQFEGSRAEEKIVGILVEFGESIFLGAFHPKCVVIAVSFAESTIMEEIVAHPDVNHGCLWRDCFYGRMRIEASSHGEESWIGDAEYPNPTIVIGNVLEEPRNGVVSIRAFVHEQKIAMIDHRAAHDKCPFGFVAPSNVLEDKDVTAGGKLGLLRTDGRGRVIVDAVRRAYQKKRKRCRGTLWAQDGGVELNAIAHGNYNILARVFRLVEQERLAADFARIAGAVHSDVIEAGDISFCGADELQGDRNVERREGIVGLRDEFEAHATTRFNEEAGAVDGKRPNEIGIIVILILSGKSTQLILGNLELWCLRLTLRNSKRGEGHQNKYTEKVARRRHVN